MILNILIAVLLIGFVALCIAYYQLDRKVEAMFYEMYEMNEDICGLEDIVITRAIEKKKK